MHTIIVEGGKSFGEITFSIWQAVGTVVSTRHRILGQSKCIQCHAFSWSDVQEQKDLQGQWGPVFPIQGSHIDYRGNGSQTG